MDKLSALNAATAAAEAAGYEKTEVRLCRSSPHRPRWVQLLGLKEGRWMMLDWQASVAEAEEAGIEFTK